MLKVLNNRHVVSHFKPFSIDKLKTLSEQLRFDHLGCLHFPKCPPIKGFDYKRLTVCLFDCSFYWNTKYGCTI